MDQINRETGEVVEPDNRLRHWASLSVTDPKHTKGFQRPGGFRGTAIRPVWNQYRLTMHFGPYGIGWGTEKPEFEVIHAGEEALVFCTLRCWYMDENGARADIYGVGGDKVMTKTQRGISTDDEAFKKAFTDALGNAFVKVGLSADVHMGLFEDSKYVEWARQQSDPRPEGVSRSDEASEAEVSSWNDSSAARTAGALAARSAPRRQEAAPAPSAEVEEAKQLTREIMDAISATEDPEMLMRFAEWPQVLVLDRDMKAAGIDDGVRRETMSMLAGRARKRREQLPGNLEAFNG